MPHASSPNAENADGQDMAFKTVPLLEQSQQSEADRIHHAAAGNNLQVERNVGRNGKSSA